MTVFAALLESSQRIVIEPEVIAHMGRFRQRSWLSREAGGQLFGSIQTSDVIVSVATGPYRGDQRWRTSYRSNAKAAQRAIDELSKKELLYLGEWHTHPEDFPKASSADHDAMKRLCDASRTRMSTLLMVIQGRSDDIAGIALYSSGPGGLVRWTVFDDLRPEQARAAEGS